MAAKIRSHSVPHIKLVESPETEMDCATLCEPTYLSEL